MWYYLLYAPLWTVKAWFHGGYWKSITRLDKLLLTASYQTNDKFRVPCLLLLPLYLSIFFRLGSQRPALTFHHSLVFKPWRPFFSVLAAAGHLTIPRPFILRPFRATYFSVCIIFYAIKIHFFLLFGARIPSFSRVKFFQWSWNTPSFRPAGIWTCFFGGIIIIIINGGNV